MLFGQRRRRGPKTEGGAAIVRAPLHVSIVLGILFLGSLAGARGAETTPPNRGTVGASPAADSAATDATELRRDCPEAFGYALGTDFRDGTGDFGEACWREAEARRESAGAKLRLMCPETFGYGRGRSFRLSTKAYGEACLREFEARPTVEQWEVCREAPGLCEDQAK